MRSIKNKVIQLLGGYTEEDWVGMWVNKSVINIEMVSPNLQSETCDYDFNQIFGLSLPLTRVGVKVQNTRENGLDKIVRPLANILAEHFAEVIVDIIKIANKGK